MIPTILNHAKSYLGTVQGDKRHKELIDQYNVVKPLPVGYKMKVTDDWCAAFVTVIADLSGAAAYIGRECGVQRYIQLFKRKEIWEGITKPRLTAAGYEAQAVQKIVDSLLKANGSILKTNEAVAKEVIAGKWGNGEARKTRLTSAGYNYSAIQKIVNSII